MYLHPLTFCLTSSTLNIETKSDFGFIFKFWQ